jgi:hypothetical protein
LNFGVHVPNEEAATSSRVLEAFRATVATIGALPPMCPKE